MNVIKKKIEKRGKDECMTGKKKQMNDWETKEQEGKKKTKAWNEKPIYQSFDQGMKKKK